MSKFSNELYILADTSKSAVLRDELEDSKPIQLNFENRYLLHDELGKLKPWPSEEAYRKEPYRDFTCEQPHASALTPAQIISTNPRFCPDYFMLGFEFFSQKFREAIADYYEYMDHYPISARSSCKAFTDQNYTNIRLNHCLNPFDRLVSDCHIKQYKDDGSVRTQFIRPDIRKNFIPIAPIFFVTASSWIFCTEDFVEKVMKHTLTGIEFIYYETYIAISPED